MAALDCSNNGKTSPGQSQSVIPSSSILIVWRCFVLPGVELERTQTRPTAELRHEDLPTFGNPTNPIVTFPSRPGPAARALALRISCLGVIRSSPGAFADTNSNLNGRL